MKRQLLGLIAALLLAPSMAAAKPAVWVAHGKHATVVLFGSIHLLPQGLDWTPPALTQALDDADELWFEIPITVDTDIQADQLNWSRGLLPAGQHLLPLLSADQAARLTRVAAGLNVALPWLDSLTPWRAEVAVSLASDAQSGADAGAGVEHAIQALASPHIRRRAFETPAEQIAFLADAPVADQVASLNETLHEIEEQPRIYDRFLSEWMDGDLGCMADDVLTPMAKVSPVLLDRVVTHRNRRWAEILGRRLRGRGTVVVIVGAAHLVGPAGVPALLRAQGIAVDGPVDGPCLRPPLAAPAGPVSTSVEPN